jgi:polar amino acid transport system substrate-binding protein
MKKALRALAFALAFSGAVARPAASADLPDIVQRGKLKVIIAGDATDTPSRFLGKQGDAFVGIEGEILAGFAHQQKVELEIAYVPNWDMLVPALVNKKSDLIGGGITATEERRKLIAFTSETFPTRDVVITRKPHRVVQTIEELRTEQVGVATGTSYVEAAKAAGVPPANLKIIEQSALDGLMRSGAVTATIEGVEFALAPQQEDPNVQLGMFLGPPQSIAFGVRKEDAQLLAALNAYIGNLRRTPTWNRLVVKYFGAHAVDVLRRARGE